MNRCNLLGGLLSAVASLAVVGCTGAETGEEDLGAAQQAISANQRITQVAVRFRTGGDDKRGGTQVDFQLNVRGTVSTYPTNRDGWANDSTTNWFYGQLPVNTVYRDIRNLGVVLTQHNGFIQTDDNWNMDGVEVWVGLPNGSWSFVGSPGGSPLKRFTGSSRQWWWGSWPAGT